MIHSNQVDGSRYWGALTMRVIGLVLASSLVCASGGRAQQAEGTFDTAPVWLRKPSPEQLLGVWPPAALAHSIAGQATIRCVVTAQGPMRDCAVLEEEPPGYGFGEAALALAPQFMMKPATRHGVAVESSITIPVRFAKVDPRYADELKRHSEIDTGSNIRRPSDHRFYRTVVWEAAPTISDVAAAYPERSRASGSTGRATLQCALARGGRSLTVQL